MPEELEGEFILGKEEANENKPPIISDNATVKTVKQDLTSEVKTKHDIKFYSSLCINPKNVQFENQEEGEEIVLLIRRDLITNVPWILTAILLIILPFIILILSDLFTPFFKATVQTQLVAALFYYLVVFGFILVEFTLWYFNVGLVTTKRIIDLDVSGILFKHVSETKLELIEDVSYKQVGAIRSLFNYGDVEIQTAGSFVNFEFDRAPEPARIVRIIADMIGRKG